MNRVPTSKEILPSESVELDLDELDLDSEEEKVGTQFTASSNGDESSEFPRDNPWITVTEEETGTKPPLLSRLWQSHVRGQDEQTNDTMDTVDRKSTRLNSSH